ncbi:hypothetical protein F9C07_1636530 [Aspergillus flavus]|uniref:F-box domain-containing protein n=1 Tax=Aspergillus flavus (strain ATCC 200026 / FGSC A1120 / IAM 13836 / NRRL 3357 / JCM 12722 / SRRC 167) TaxID=332952 RepID=A0A7U2MHI1_ASPFN|nr:hypothetical protein F9C07_1636530 [Aspergillus flavus]
MTESPASPLLDLPRELQRLIINKLDYPSTLSLSQTNKYFRIFIPTQPPSTILLRRRYLCDKETWPGYEKYFACSRCLHLLHYSHFRCGQVRGKWAKLCSGRCFRACIGCLAHECFTLYMDRYRNRPGANGRGPNVDRRAAQATVPPYWPPPNPVQPPAYPAQPSMYLAQPSAYSVQPSAYPALPFTYSAVPPVSEINYYNGHGGSYLAGGSYYIYCWLATI